MNTNNNSPNQDSGELTPDLRTMLMEIHDYITELKRDYDKFVSDVRIDRVTLQELLGVSEATIGRWRTRGVLPYYVNSSRASYYLFDEVYVAVKRGQLEARGFNRINALERLKVFKNGLLFQVRTGINPDDMK